MLESELEIRLNVLQAELSKQPSLVDGVMRQIGQSPVARRRGSQRWLLPSSIGLAAAVITAACWLAFASRTAPVYGIDDLPGALLKVKSIHVKGKFFHARGNVQGVVEIPTESFVERPCRSWGQGFGITNDDPPRIQFHARDGQQVKYVNPNDKTFVIADDDPLLAELSVETAFQNVLLAKLFGGGPEQFHRVGEERINGRLTDRYERIQLESEDRREGSKYVVWLDPTTGLPVRAATYDFDGPRPDDLRLSIIEDIDVNVAARQEMFDFDPPPGYQVIDGRGQKQPLSFSGSAGNDDERFGIGPVLNIDDRAFLVCWGAYEVSQSPPLETELQGPPGRIIEPGKFSVLSGPHKYHHVYLRADASKEFHWRWSLLVSHEPDRPIGNDSPTLRMNAKAGGSMNMGIDGLRFPRRRLESLVIEVQRLTLPPDSPADTPFTLAQIEEIIDGVQRSNE